MKSLWLTVGLLVALALRPMIGYFAWIFLAFFVLWRVQCWIKDANER